MNSLKLVTKLNTFIREKLILPEIKWPHLGSYLFNNVLFYTGAPYCLFTQAGGFAEEVLMMQRADPHISSQWSAPAAIVYA